MVELISSFPLHDTSKPGETDEGGYEVYLRPWDGFFWVKFLEAAV